MNPDRLLQHFERISEAPDAIPRLRRFILDLAVRGKLMEQDPNDEPAEELLKRISKLTDQSFHLERLSGGHFQFALPQGWEWARLGAITTKTGSGSTPRGGQAIYQASGVPFLRSQNVYDDGLRLKDVAYIDDTTHTKMRGTAVEPGDLLLNITGGSIGRCCRIPDAPIQANISQHVAIIRLALAEMRDFLHKAILSPFFQSFVIDEQTGAGRGGLPKNRMDRIPVPIPPLAEQHRIVAKVDELMALCDQLEAAKTGREQRRDGLVAASLQRLNQPANDEAAFREHARFTFSHLPRLTTRPEHIKQLRQTILNLAVRGKLVPQDPKDEPASKTLERAIRQNSERWNKELATGGSSRVTKIPSRYREVLVPNSNGLFELPSIWKWVSWESILAFGDGAFKRGPFGSALTKSIFVASGYKVYEQYCPINDDCSFSRYYITPQKFKELESFSVRARDFLISCSGVTLGRITQVPDEYEEGVINQALLRVRTDKALIDDVFFKMLFRSPYFQEKIFSNSMGMAIPNVKGVSELKAIPLPLPPLAEQHRIVAKVDELMAICDQLETHLAATDADSRRLLEALLTAALASPLSKAK